MVIMPFTIVATYYVAIALPRQISYTLEDIQLFKVIIFYCVFKASTINNKW